MAQQFQIHRVTSLPTKLVAGAIYLVAPAGKDDYVEMYVINNAGDKARRIIKEEDITALIQTQIRQNQAAPIIEVKVVENYRELQKLGGDDTAVFVYVKDATGSDSVTIGGALFAKTPGVDTGWTKISETESMDLVLDWDSIQGKPNKTAQEIEEAVTQKHTHENLEVLNKLADDAGNLTYGGKAISTQWITTDW